MADTYQLFVLDINGISEAFNWLTKNEIAFTEVKPTEFVTSAKYISTTCSYLCSERTKRSVNAHLGLYERILSAKTPQVADPAYVVLEDLVTPKSDFATTLQPICDAMKANSIDIVYLTTDYFSRLNQPPIALAAVPAYKLYRASSALSLAGYVITLAGVKKMRDYFLANPVTTSLNVDLDVNAARAHLSRAVLDPSLVTIERVAPDIENNGSFLSRWLEKYYPRTYNMLHTPILSLFGKIDINILSAVVLIVAVLFIMFGVTSPFGWFLLGLLVADAF
ncbi:ORF132 [Saltwater crocodilepox virus]|nr:IMV envelope protein [Saltwater crocodilepox virus]AVD69467.1 IMV envelope protein [Saltwater crocodilepox virus]QGT46570.1 ORF132 [Saltwater crocodilepox virus]QGT46786.1 ORF132 [Saltwater crocodilepox virus]QGT47002.1 ORF132 [Saltwater crocodilepox virus]